MAVTTSTLDSATLRGLAKREVEQFRGECTELAFAVACEMGQDHPASQYFARHGLSELFELEREATAYSDQDLEKIRGTGQALLNLFRDTTGEDRAEAVLQLVGQFVYRIRSQGFVEHSTQGWVGQVTHGGPAAPIRGGARSFSNAA